MDEDTTVADIHGLDDVDDKLDSQGLEPAYIPAFRLPVRHQLKGKPSVLDKDAYAPRSASINKDSFVNEWAPRSELSVCVGRYEGVKPPLEVSDDRFWWIASAKLITLEGSGKIGEGREAGSACCVDKGDIAKGPVYLLNVA